MAIAIAVLGTAYSFGAAPLSSIAAIHQLTNDQATQRIPFHFQATVTFKRSYENTLFFHDGDSAIYGNQPAA